MLNYDQVYKALSICTDKAHWDCKGCPYLHNGCRTQMESDAFEIIKEQQQSIENLKEIIEIMEN